MSLKQVFQGICIRRLPQLDFFLHLNRFNVILVNVKSGDLE